MTLFLQICLTIFILELITTIITKVLFDNLNEWDTFETFWILQKLYIIFVILDSITAIVILFYIIWWC